MNAYDIELPLLPCKPAYEHYSSTLVVTLEDAEDAIYAAIEPYAKRIAELEAARIAYASEFAPDEDGNPDVGSIHENIRKLKADLQRRGEQRVIGRIKLDGNKHPRAELSTGYDENGDQWKEGTPIYAAPQPTKPVKTDSAGYTLGPVSDGSMDPRNVPAEPVKYERIAGWTKGGIESLCLSLEIQQEQSGGGSKACAVAASLLRGISEQHFAEPVKVPSDAEIEALAKEYMFAHAQFVGAGEVWYEGEVEFARALLARYG